MLAQLGMQADQQEIYGDISKKLVYKVPNEDVGQQISQLRRQKAQEKKQNVEKRESQIRQGFIDRATKGSKLVEEEQKRASQSPLQ